MRNKFGRMNGHDEQREEIKNNQKCYELVTSIYFLCFSKSSLVLAKRNRHAEQPKSARYPVVCSGWQFTLIVKSLKKIFFLNGRMPTFHTFGPKV